jgi:hypothetical protein
MMIALSIFSVTILLTAAVIVGIAKQYQKSTYTARLNDASRTIHTTIGDSISYGGAIISDHASTVGASGFYFFCSDTDRYFWKLSSGSSVQGSYPGLYKDNNDTCADPTEADAALAQSLLPTNSFVTEFSIVPQSGNIYKISSTFKVGSPDMYEDSNHIESSSCLPTQKGGDFCTVVTYNSSVVKKVGSNL